MDEAKRTHLMMESLPDELLIEIIIRLPAGYIYNVARLVCWKWYRMIHTHDFIYEHFQRTSSGLLFISEDSHPIIMTVRQTGEIEIEELSNVPRRPIAFVSGCNGLLLLLEYNSICRKSLYISNPATNQIFVLPPFSRQSNCYLTFDMSYVATSMEYKVVIADGRSANNQNPYPCRILTAGVDKSWRNVYTQHLSYRFTFLFACSPLINIGFMDWVMDSPWSHPMLTLNVETETITLSTPPSISIYKDYECSWTFLPTGTYLSLLIMYEESLWELWEMKPESGEWRELLDFTLDVGQYCTKPRPVGWLRYPELLIFFVWRKRSCNVVVYDLVTEEMKPISSPDLQYAYKLIAHKNSLESLDPRFSLFSSQS